MRTLLPRPGAFLKASTAPAFLLLTVVLASAAAAQTPPPVPVSRTASVLSQRPAVEDASRQVDEIAMLQRAVRRLHEADAERAARLDALTAEFEALSASLAALQRRTTFTCVFVEGGPSEEAGWISENGDGVREDCDGYACAAVDGRCYRDCVSTDECGSGYACDIASRRCVVASGSGDG